MGDTTQPAPDGATPGGGVRELLQRWFGARDRDALDELLRRVLPFMHRHAHGRMHDKLRGKEDTGDVIQEAIVDFMHYAPPFAMENEQQLRGLLAKIVDGVVAGHHRWFAQIRRDIARERPLPEGTSVAFRPIAASDPSPSNAAKAGEREAALRLAILSLDPLDQKIVLLRTYQGRSFVAIGAEVGVTDEAARKRFTRGMQRLSAKLMALGEGRIDEFLA